MTVSFLTTEIRAKDPIREAIADQVLWFEKQREREIEETLKGWDATNDANFRAWLQAN